MNTEHTKCPAMEPRLPLDDDKPDGYMESDQSFTGHNREWLAWCEANARLIAAAPELLAALIQAESALRYAMKKHDPAAAFSDAETAKAAIARATGK